MAFMFTACAALRLARFNVTSPGRYRGRFEGLAEPARAPVWCSRPCSSRAPCARAACALELPACFGALGLAVLGLLMVSPIPYRSFKDVKLGGSYRSGRLHGDRDSQ